MSIEIRKEIKGLGIPLGRRVTLHEGEHLDFHNFDYTGRPFVSQRKDYRATALENDNLRIDEPATGVIEVVSRKMLEKRMNVPGTGMRALTRLSMRVAKAKS